MAIIFYILSSILAEQLKQIMQLFFQHHRYAAMFNVVCFLFCIKLCMLYIAIVCIFLVDFFVYLL